jgi:peptidoglycan-associated lipoprotein
MKLTKIFNLMVLGTSLTVAATGCRHTPLNTTTLRNPNDRVADNKGLDQEKPLRSPNDPLNDGTFGENSRMKLGPGHPGWAEDHDSLKAETIYFDYDKSAVKSSEQSKLDSVASYMKSHPEVAIRAEGNCDERGTEEYNRALGERRALAAREYLVRHGIESDRVDTISYGLDHPVEAAHSESAFSKNRRDDFTVLTRPGK